MSFISRQERDELVENISKSLRSNKPKKEKEEKPEARDEERISGEIPLDEVLPPSHGHETGLRVPNTSAYNQPYKGGLYVESIEERLFRLLENINGAKEDPKASTSPKSADSKGDDRGYGQQQVGTTGTVTALGNTKATEEPRTESEALRQEKSAFAKQEKRKESIKDVSKAEADKEEESPEDMLSGAIEDLGTSGEAQVTPSA